LIKFFRQIRRSLMGQNRTSKYLKYALGEILLVMIGILLALQVNNWNEERKRFKSELITLKELREDTKADSIFFISRLEALKLHLYSIDILNTMLINKKYDSLASLPFPSSQLVSNNDILDISLAYQSAVNSNYKNRIEEITNANIKSILRDYTLAYHYVELHYDLKDEEYAKYLSDERQMYHKFHLQVNSETSFGDYFKGIDYPQIESKVNYVSKWASSSILRTENLIKINGDLLIELNKYLDKVHD